MNTTALSTLPMILAIGIFYLLFKAIKGSLGGGGKVDPVGRMICPACGTRGQPATKTRGSLAIEIVLWLCLFIPGLVYSIWRLTTRVPVCPACDAEGMIPVNSPVGRRLSEAAGREQHTIEI